MSVIADNPSSVVRYSLVSTRATTACPFHLDVTIRLGDDAAESHAMARARNIIRSDGTRWEEVVLRKEFERQLGEAADRYCPRCSCSIDDPSI